MQLFVQNLFGIGWLRLSKIRENGLNFAARAICLQNGGLLLVETVVRISLLTNRDLSAMLIKLQPGRRVGPLSIKPCDKHLLAAPLMKFAGDLRGG